MTFTQHLENGSHIDHFHCTPQEFILLCFQALVSLAAWGPLLNHWPFTMDADKMPADNTSLKAIPLPRSLTGHHDSAFLPFTDLIVYER